MINNSKIIFITFGDGSIDYRNAGIRLGRQAESMGIFDEVYVADYKYLNLNCTTEMQKHEKFIKQNKRGYGYWIWKPMILNHLMSKFPEGSIVFYADSGCEMSPNGISKLKSYIKKMITNSAIFFKLPYKESMYTKKDLLDHPKIKLHNAHLYPQYQATYFIIKINAKIKSIISTWYEIATEDNYRYVNDTPSFGEESKDYLEHRHDQSIISCLLHAHNLNLQFYSYNMNPKYCNSLFQKEFIYDLRNRTGESLLEKFSNKCDLICNAKSASAIIKKVKFRVLVYLKVKSWYKS